MERFFWKALIRDDRQTGDVAAEDSSSSLMVQS